MRPARQARAPDVKLRWIDECARGGRQQPQSSIVCSTKRMSSVVRPDWWCYPLQCPAGHPWAPGRVTVGWMPCDCPSVTAGNVLGHLWVRCRADGCPSIWYRPRHQPPGSARPLAWSAPADTSQAAGLSDGAERSAVDINALAAGTPYANLEDLSRRRWNEMSAEQSPARIRTDHAVGRGADGQGDRLL